MTRVQALIRAESFPRFTMSILTFADGHRDVTWSPDDEGSVAVAEREFANAVGNGMSAFSVGEEAGVGTEQIKSFDPETHERVVLIPQTQGG